MIRFGFEGMKHYLIEGNFLMAQWLSWLERRPVTAEVTGSSPVWVVVVFTTKIKYYLFVNLGS